jgi:hypothetical protein
MDFGNFIPEEFSDTLIDFDVDPFLFPYDPLNIPTTLIAGDFFQDKTYSVIPTESESTDSTVENLGKKRKYKKHSQESKEEENKKSPLLNPSLISFFAESNALFNEGDMEAYENLTRSICNKNLKFSCKAPGFYNEGVGIENLIKFLRAVLTSFPDELYKEGNLKLARDKGGIFISTNFEFVGTRTVRTRDDKLFLGDDGFFGMMDLSKIAHHRIETFKSLSEAEKSNNDRVCVTVVGVRKMYIDISSNKFKSLYYEWKISDLIPASGKTLSFV